MYATKMEVKEGQWCIHKKKGKETVDGDPWIHLVVKVKHKDKEDDV
jgi:hypothetical protein